MNAPLRRIASTIRWVEHDGYVSGYALECGHVVEKPVRNRNHVALPCPQCALVTEGCAYERTCAASGDRDAFGN